MTAFRKTGPPRPRDDGTALPNRDLVVGLMLCLAFCVLAVAVRGVRWDETWEYAQIMTGKAPYPEGHPMIRYTFGAYSLPNYLSAGMLWIGLGPMWICGFRNVLFLFATIAPVFLITSVLARNVVWGCVAALLALEGIYLEFDGSYPLMTWPELYSNGHIGGGWALFSLGLLMSGFAAAGFFLTGLMPCIHIGQVLPLFFIAAGYCLFEMRRGSMATLKRILLWGLAGCVVSATFLALQKCVFSLPAPASGPYFSNEDADALWRSYTAYHDIHRQPPPGNGQVVLLGAILLCAGAAWFDVRGTSGKDRSQVLQPFRILLMYSAAVWAIVWGTMLSQALLGTKMPFVLIGWMPYRLVNHIGPLLLCAVVGILGRRGKPEGAASCTSVCLIGALVYYLVLPLLPHVVGSAIWSRYLARGDGLFFALYGAAIGSITVMMWEQGLWKKRWPAAIGLGVVALAAYHHFGATCLAGGVVLALLGRAWEPRLGRFVQFAARPAVAWALCVAVALLMLGQQWHTRRQLPTSEFDRHISQYLQEQGQPVAMLAGAPNEFMLQARTGHPVFAEAATASYLTYMPELGPVFQKMLFDMYGLRFDRKGGGEETSWRELWHARPREEWQRLAKEYSFHYVIASDPTPPDLPLAFRDGPNALYRVPE